MNKTILNCKKKLWKKYIHICTISRIVSWGRDDRPAQSPLSHCPVSGVWSLSLYTVSLRSAASSQPRPPAPALIVKVGAAPIQKISGEQVICRILSLNSIELWRSRLNDWMSLTFFKSNLVGLSPPPPNSSNFFKRFHWSSHSEWQGSAKISKAYFICIHKIRQNKLSLVSNVVWLSWDDEPQVWDFKL